MKLYYFVSSNKKDKLSVLTIGSATLRKAYCLAILHFKKHNYVGTPKQLAI